MTVLGGLQFKRECKILAKFKSFNTDDGIRRATIAKQEYSEMMADIVSIPMTVLGGLQCIKILPGAKSVLGFQYR